MQGQVEDFSFMTAAATIPEARLAIHHRWHTPQREPWQHAKDGICAVLAETVGLREEERVECAPVTEGTDQADLWLFEYQVSEFWHQS